MFAPQVARPPARAAQTAIKRPAGRAVPVPGSAIGNQARLRLAARPALQPKLAVGPVDDPLEAEADRVADRVMRMPDPGLSIAAAAPRLSRKCAACAEEDERAMQKKAAPGARGGAAPRAVHDTLRAPGRPLDTAARTFFEPRFGRDFSGVRVHADAGAAGSARAVGALAYTVGEHIAFAAGQYHPGTQAGQRLLAHELAHVVQQAGGASAVLQRDAGEEAVDDAVEEDEAFEYWTHQGYRGSEEDQKALDAMAKGEPPPPAYHDIGAHTNWGTAADQREKQVAAWHQQMARETPMMVLSPGGEPPDFVTEGTRTSSLSAEGDEAQYTPKYFHVLDAIAHDVAIAASPDELYGVYFAYFAGIGADVVAMRNIGIPASYTARDGKVYHPRLPADAAIGRVNPDFSTGYDKAGTERLAAFKSALAQRARARREARQQRSLQEAETTALRERGGRRREGPCDATPGPHSGGNARHNAYARHVADERGYQVVAGREELTWTTPEGVSYGFDVYNPADRNKVWEVKTQHEWASPTGLATAPYRLKDWEGRIAGLEAQRLRGLYVANRCGLNFRYAVDNCPFFQTLSVAWPIPPVEYIAYEGETRVPCPPGGDYPE